MAELSKWAEGSPDECVGDVAQRSLRMRLEAVVIYLELAATKSEQDVEHVHQMRVWSRRSVSALTLYRTLSPDWRVAQLKMNLGRIRRAANDARDDDVFAARLEKDRSAKGARHLLEKVQEHRKRAQEPINRIHRRLGENGKLAHRTEKLLKRIGQKKRAEEAARRFGDWAAERLHAEVAEFHTAAKRDLSDEAILHQFRIAGKSLRYAIELLAPAFPDVLRNDVYPMIKDLQDRLGDINDHATAYARLKHWSGEADAKSERTYLHDRLETEREFSDKLRGEFLDWWNGSREAEIQAAIEAAITTP